MRENPVGTRPLSRRVVENVNYIQAEFPVQEVVFLDLLELPRRQFLPGKELVFWS